MWTKKLYATAADGEQIEHEFLLNTYGLGCLDDGQPDDFSGMALMCLLSTTAR
jgi:hypothetical protein